MGITLWPCSSNLYCFSLQFPPGKLSLMNNYSFCHSMTVLNSVSLIFYPSSVPPLAALTRHHLSVLSFALVLVLSTCYLHESLQGTYIEDKIALFLSLIEYQFRWKRLCNEILRKIYKEKTSFKEL